MTYDVVLFGGTGFTGGLAARYLAANAPAGCRWALAGRNRAKLEALRSRLAVLDPACEQVPLLHADVDDAASLRAVADDARVVITTVGPYVEYGEPLVAACADAGTDYVDLTGEPEFVDLMYLRHHARAVRTGARIVHACGFDSIPHDLGVYFTVQQLPEGVPIAVDGYVRAAGTVSGGTLHSAVTAASRARQNLAIGRERRRIEPRPAGRRVRGSAGSPGHSEELGWVLPLPTLDPQIVARSAAALDRYGPDFRYRHHAAVKHLSTVAGIAGGLAAVGLLAQLPQTRRMLLNLRKPGDGPSEQRRAKSWFSVRFIGEGLTGDGTVQRVVTEVSGGDPGYDETAKMLVESALCLAYDELPPTSGQVTTAAAMGDALIARLRAAGLSFNVLQRSSATSSRP